MAELPTDDQQLLRQIRLGDETAFATFYERHQGAIYRFVLHMTGSQATAEEVTQEVFMLVIRNPKGYKSAQGSLAAYLFGTARNLARRASRQSYLHVPLEESQESERAQFGELDALEKLSRSEGLALLHKMLLALPEQYREVIVLCDLEEISYADAATILNCTSGTVASRLHRAHAMLKTKIESLVRNKPCLT